MMESKWELLPCEGDVRNRAQNEVERRSSQLNAAHICRRGRYWIASAR